MIIDRESLVGHRRSGDVAAEPLEFFSFVLLADSAGMDGEAGFMSGIGFVASGCRRHRVE